MVLRYSYVLYLKKFLVLFRVFYFLSALTFLSSLLTTEYLFLVLAHVCSVIIFLTFLNYIEWDLSEWSVASIEKSEKGYLCNAVSS